MIPLLEDSIRVIRDLDIKIKDLEEEIVNLKKENEKEKIVINEKILNIN